MAFERIGRGEWIAVAGGVLLAIGLFLGWYHLENPNASLAGHTGPDTLSGWSAHPVMRWFLLAGAAAPLILAWIIIREHALSWPRGQMTSITAIAALGLLVWVGVINRPGDPRSLTHLRFGWVVALLGGILMLAGSVIRQAETETRRKPPGTI
jgi:uncharacterized membrane protein